MGILQARILEWVAILFSRGSSWPRDQTHISCIAGRFFLLSEPPVKPPQFWDIIKIQLLGRKLRHTAPHHRPLFASPEKHKWVVSDYEISFSTILQTVLKNFPQTLSWLVNDIKANTRKVLVKVLVAQSSLTLCDPMSCSPSGSSVHGIL